MVRWDWIGWGLIALGFVGGLMLGIDILIQNSLFLIIGGVLALVMDWYID